MRSISLYVHVPFCRRRCPYCTFYHVPMRDEDATGRFVDAVVHEFESEARVIDGPISIPSMYLGGGTPALLGGRLIGRIIEAARPFLDDAAEITVEANPEDIDDAMLSSVAEAGVNRLSLGIQSLSPRAQKILNRCNPQANRTAMTRAARYFENVSYDLLLGIPGGDRAELVATLHDVVEHGPAHLSVYCLEPGGDVTTPKRDFFERVEPERSADEYLCACDTLVAAGYEHYEISSFARPGRESVHNRRYWDWSEYLGVGPSAHSFIGGDRFFNPASLDDYLRDDLRAAGSSRQKEPRGDGERRLEELMLGLRTSAGYPLARLAEKAEVIQRLIDGGLGARSGGNLVLTPRGFLVLNEIVHRLHSAA